MELRFSSLDAAVAEQEAIVPTALPTDFATAKVAYLAGAEWVVRSKAFFTLEDHVTDYVTTLQDHSCLYKRLAFFAEAPDDKCKLHKRRVDMLAGIEKELNPQYFLQVCRQLQYELAETVQEMAYQKRSKFSDANPPDAHAHKKINKLTMQAIRWYQSFVDSCRDLKTNEVPEQLEDTVVRPFLRAKFQQADLWRRVLVGSAADYVANSQRSIALYNECIAYCAVEKNSDPNYHQFAEELALAKEMVQMIPIKMRKELDAAAAAAR